MVIYPKNGVIGIWNRRTKTLILYYSERYRESNRRGSSYQAGMSNLPREALPAVAVRIPIQWYLRAPA